MEHSQARWRAPAEVCAGRREHSVAYCVDAAAYGNVARFVNHRSGALRCAAVAAALGGTVATTRVCAQLRPQPVRAARAGGAPRHQQA